jgi:hypothetical protein
LGKGFASFKAEQKRREEKFSVSALEYKKARVALKEYNLERYKV